MSWRDNKKRGGGYARGRDHRRNRGGGNNHYGSSETTGEDGDAGQRQYSRYHGGGSYRGRPYKRPQANHSYNGKRAKYEVGERLKEDDIGVTEFVGNHKRFAGIVKERYGDFHVHEISCDGAICKLTNQDMPPDPQDLKDMDQLKESIPAEVRGKLEDFEKSDSPTSSVEIDVTDMDKETRRNIHIIAKKIPSVMSQTVERDDKKIIVLAKKQGQRGHKFRGDQREDWSSREGDYCHFLLHKVNMDTMDALNQLALKLRLKPDVFHYAGTKDRRARTTQWVSLKKVNPTNIHYAARQVPGALVGNFKFAKEPLRLGLLDGNRFRIALRSVDGNDNEIERAVNSLRDNGFINYYGLQRFGTIAAIPTHVIGKALLQGKWEDAIELILKPREGEQQRDMIEAREIYQKTKNAEAALKPLARSGKIEAKLLKGIAVSGSTNPLGALDYIPRNARLMYIHSYQSFVWNHIVSRRFKELGSKPIVGDLVYENKDSKDVVESETMDYVLQNDNDKDEKSDKPDEETKKVVEKDDSMKKNVEEPSDEASEKENNDDEEIPTKIEETEDSSKKENIDGKETPMKIEESEDSGEKENIDDKETSMKTENTEDSSKKENIDDKETATKSEKTEDPLEKENMDDEETSMKTEKNEDSLDKKNIEGEETSKKTEITEDSDIPTEEMSEIVVSKDKVEEKAKTEDEPIDDPKDQSNLPAVKALTEEDLPNYTLADVVMPKPGWKVTYPAYAKPWFDEFLAKDNLTTDLRQKNMKYSLGGGYRKILEKPGDLTWKIARYNGYHDDLILSDVDEMRGVELTKQEPDGKYKALILEFSLPSSTYATMALREILEHDTSAQTQAAQSTANQAQERKDEESKKMETDEQPTETETKPQDSESKITGDAKSDDPKTDVADNEPIADANDRPNVDENPSDEKMEIVQTEKNANDEKMEIVQAEKNANDEKMEIVQNEKKTSEDKMEIVQNEKKTSDEKMEIVQNEKKTSDEKMEIVENEKIASDEKIEIVNNEKNSSEEKIEIVNNEKNASDEKIEIVKNEKNTSDEKIEIVKNEKNSSDEKIEIVNDEKNSSDEKTEIVNNEKKASDEKTETVNNEKNSSDEKTEIVNNEKKATDEKIEIVNNEKKASDEKIEIVNNEKNASDEKIEIVKNEKNIPEIVEETKKIETESNGNSETTEKAVDG